MLTKQEILTAIPTSLNGSDFPELGEKYVGRARDVYRRNGQRVLISTDRISAFDRVLGSIPHKGQVLNQLSYWWFAQTADLIPNHIISIPDPNVTIAQQAEPMPVEVVVRGYITGVTSNSLWYRYEHGERQPFGIKLPDGLRKNDPLPQPIITPMTRATAGNARQPLTSEEVVSRDLVAADLWDLVEMTALSIYARGREVARQAGLILVDTKYQFGWIDGRLTLIDELHTPDSSRYWLAESYKPGGGILDQPVHFDKEYLRQWFTAHFYYGEGTPPEMRTELIVELASRYITAFEKLTGTTFVPGAQPANPRIRQNLGLD